jgi:hypothetical protein
VLRRPVGVGVVGLQAQDGVIFQQAIKNVKGLAGRAGDDSGAKDGILIADMGVGVAANSCKNGRESAGCATRSLLTARP